MQGWGGRLENWPSFSGPAFPFPGEKICCLLGRKQFRLLTAATLDMQSVTAVFKFYLLVVCCCFGRFFVLFFVGGSGLFFF